jgi:hypothetical protein
MQRFLSISVILTLLPLLLRGGEGVRQIRISERGLTNAVKVGSADGHLSLIHARAVRSIRDSSKNVLVYGAYVPSVQSVAVAACTPATLRPFVSVMPAGSYGGRPVVHIEVDLLGHTIAVGGLLSGFELSLATNGPVVDGPFLQPPAGPDIINATWNVGPLALPSKPAEAVLGGTDPAQWYHQARDFVRLETARDGVAKLQAADVLSLGTFRALDSIGLFWRGRQQPIYIDDADRSSTFTSADVIYFLGRRASGDTSYLDEHDTTSVFYLTGTLTGQEPLRLRLREALVSGADSAVRWLDMHERYELDTGYFHPGNGIDDDHGKLYTQRAALEGFYWSTLNARNQQSGHYPISFIAAEGAYVEVTSDIVTTLDSKMFDPDHAFDVILPGADSSRRVEVDGYGRHLVRDTVRSADFPPVMEDLFVQATGFPERRDSVNWVSLVLVDGVEVSGKGASILQQGRLAGRLDLPGRVDLHLSNLPDSSCVVIDTITGEVVVTKFTKRSNIVRAGAWLYRSTKRPLDAQSGRYRVTAAIGDNSVSDDSVTRYAVIRQLRAPDRLVVQRVQDATSLAQAIDRADRQEPLIVVNVAAQTSALVRQALERRGVNVDEDTYPGGWIASCAGSAGTISALRRHVAEYEAPNGTSGALSVSMSGTSHALFVGSGAGIEQARVRRATNAFVSREDWSKGADVIAIVHRDLLGEAQRWVQHRQSHSNVRIRMVDVEAIFEAYDAGRHTPQAIKAFLKDAWLRSLERKPKYCVLIGNASWDQRVAVKASNVDARRADLIPSYGQPVSDFWYGLLDDETDLITPELIVSRLPALKSAELGVVVDKIIQADTSRWTPKKRTFLYAGGGKPDESFCDIFGRILRDEFGSGVDFTAPPLCIDTLVVCKELVEQPGRVIRSHINDGVALINFFGHGGTELFDIEDWTVGQLANEGRYPILATFSCLTGGFASPSTTCENAKYLFEPRKGAVAAIGATGLQYVSTADFLLYRIHEVLASTKKRAIGELTYEAKRSLALLNTTFGNNATHQFCILGDPFTRIRIDTTVEVSLPPQAVVFSTASASNPIVETDSVVLVEAEIWSEGVGTDSAVMVRLLRSHEGATDTLTAELSDGLCRRSAVRFLLPVFGKSGRNEIVITVDPDGRLGDRTENNSVTLTLDVAKPSLLILEPEARRVVSFDSLRIRVIDVLSTGSRNVPVNIAVCSRRDTTSWITRSTATELRRVAGTPLCDWTMPASTLLDTSRTYWIGAWPSLASPDAAVSVQWQPVQFTRALADITHHRLSAEEVRAAAPLSAYDSLAKAIVLPVRPVPLAVRSAGKATSDPVREPYMSFRLRDSLLLENSFRQGLNIMVFSVYDSLPRAVRRYDTSPFGSPIETGHNGYARECVAFLRDSLRDEDIVAIAACDESFTRFQRDGLFDEFKSLLRGFGSTRADSLSVSTSFAFIGSRGYRRLTTVERLSTEGSIVVATADVPFTWDSLRVPVVTPSQRRWRGIRGSGDGAVSLRLARRNDTGQVDTVNVRGDWVPEEGVDYDLLSIDLRASATSPVPAFTQTELYFLQRPQVFATNVEAKPRVVQRGDTMLIEAEVMNTRFDPDSISVLLQVVMRDTSGNIIQSGQEQLNVGPNARALFRSSVATEFVSGTVSLELVIDEPLKQSMRYGVFTRALGSANVVEDSIAPVVELSADGVRRTSGMAVSVNPRFDVLLRDNSALSIESADNLVVFVNGTRVRPGTAEEWEFYGTRQLAASLPVQPDARAMLSFRFPMEIGENLVIIRARDATGNPDTSEISLFLPTSATIVGMSVFPNPTATGMAGVSVDLAIPDGLSLLRVTAYDLQGRRISTSTLGVSNGHYRTVLGAGEYPLETGMYTVVAELMDEAGKTLSTLTKKLVVSP